MDNVRKFPFSRVAAYVCLIAMIAVFVFGCVDVVRADTTITADLPDFATYAESQGVNLDDFPYYAVHYFKNESGIVYDCLFFKDTSEIKYYSGAGVGCNMTVTSYHNPPSGAYCVRYRTYSNEFSEVSWCLWFYEDDPSFANVTEGGMLYSNFDILSASDGSRFFLATPLRSYPTSIGGTITAQTIVQALTMEQIGLVPLAVGLAVLVIALYKGLAVLYRLLKTL